MKILRSAALCALAVFAVFQAAEEASAGDRYRMHILWPRIYSPHVSGYLYRDDAYEEDDEAFYDDEEEIIVPRRHRHRDMVMDYYDEEDLEPVYEPPVRKAAPLKPKKATASKKPVSSPDKTASTIVKPKVKPAAKKPVVVANLTDSESNVSAKSQTATALKTSAPLTTQSIAKAPEKAPATKQAPTPVKLASAASPAAKQASGAAIGCGKGAEIVSGYGFTSVKPRLCTGTTYSFDATRAANAYLIKVSAATGEITDVQKLK